MASHTILFRCDVSPRIGSGHFMRCMKLAEGLKRRGMRPVFVSSQTNDYVCSQLNSRSICFKRIKTGDTTKFKDDDYKSWLSLPPEEDAALTLAIAQQVKADFIIVDHYGIDASWEKAFSDYPIIVIDDLANRRHSCRLLIDSNEFIDKDERYGELIPKGADLFTGCTYALLDERITGYRPKSLTATPGQVRQIFVCYGGSDPTHETMRLLPVMMETTNFKWHIVIGPMNTRRDEILRAAEGRSHLVTHVDPEDIYRLMTDCDFAFGAGGTMTWERAAIGLPMALTALADNQIKVCEDLNKMNYVEYLGMAGVVTSEDYEACIAALTNNALHLEFEKLFFICQGQGIEKVCQWIQNFR